MALESREVPANVTWTNASGDRDFNNPANWISPGTPVQHAVPTQFDTVRFDGNPGPGINAANANVGPTFPNTNGQADKVYEEGIEIVNGFTGTVVFPSNVTFGSYTQTSGDTEHEGSNRTITITSQFNWTGGRIDYNSGFATYHLVGVEQGKMGDNGTALYTGANFVLDASLEGATEGPAVIVPSNIRQSGVLHMRTDYTTIEVGPSTVFGQDRANPAGPPIDPKIVVDQVLSNDSVGPCGVVVKGGRFFSKNGRVPAVTVDQALVG
jgi:hypothetical protein